VRSVSSKRSSSRSSIERACIWNAAVVDQHVELAEALDRLVDRALAELRVFHVALDGQALAAFALDPAAGFARILFLTQVDDRDVGAFACEQHRHRAPDARIAPGDQRGEALQLGAAAIVRRFEQRLLLHLCFDARLLQLLLRMLRRVLARACLHRAILGLAR
jgi:hypothetical protein